ncbi:hypothetical protein C7C46_29155 [Streptomyces tateyamensis]|uniref:Uncharacterized protein n=1 Tax=Streptomyces tateyamensis TaxID=565073 RepID=A0A2V4MYF8_9ACTN|nr:hypothetical protein C7C46_29155 [Streptomyces tateyamensis]
MPFPSTFWSGVRSMPLAVVLTAMGAILALSPGESAVEELVDVIDVPLSMLGAAKRDRVASERAPDAAGAGSVESHCIGVGACRRTAPAESLNATLPAVSVEAVSPVVLIGKCRVFRAGLAAAVAVLTTMTSRQPPSGNAVTWRSTSEVRTPA